MAAGRLLAPLVAVAVLAGCEQQPFYSVYNDMEHPVVVRFDYLGNVLVAPGANGRSPSTFGPFEGQIVVMDEECRVLYTVEVTTQAGNIWLKADGTVRFAETEYDFAMSQLPPTDLCAGGPE